MKGLNIKKIITSQTTLPMLFPYLNIKLPFFVYLLIHITLKCNRTCDHCYQSDSFYEKSEMDISLLEDIFKERSKMFFKPFVHLFGGEPLFFKKMEELMRLVEKYKVKLSLTTNGDLLNNNTKFFKSQFVKQVNISVNPPALENLEEYCLQMVSSIEKLKTANPALIINLNYNLNPKHYMYLLKVFCFFSKACGKGLVDVFVIQHYMHTKIKDVCDFDCAKIKTMLAVVKKTKADFSVRILPQVKDIDTYYQSSDFMSHKCYAPFFGLSVLPNGKVAAGGAVFGCNVVLGDLQKESLADVWRSDKLKQFTLRMRKKLPQACIRCCQKIY